VLARLALIPLIALAPVTDASAGVQVHATCATELSRDVVHVRTLREEVGRALASTPVAARYTLDVSLVALSSATVGRELEVRVELRALLSDDRGRARWQTTSRAIARGAHRQRALLEKEALGAAARDLAKTVRAQTKA
jgi:hypothetical protein